MIAAGALLAGCADDVAKPVPLEPLEAKITGHQVWKLSLGGAAFSSLTGSAWFAAQGVAVAGNNLSSPPSTASWSRSTPPPARPGARTPADACRTGIGSDGRLDVSVRLCAR